MNKYFNVPNFIILILISFIIFRPYVLDLGFFFFFRRVTNSLLVNIVAVGKYCRF